MKKITGCIFSIVFSILLAVTGVAGSVFAVENTGITDNTKTEATQEAGAGPSSQSAESADGNQDTEDANADPGGEKTTQDPAGSEESAKATAFTGRAEDIRVSVNAPAGAFPDGTTMAVRKIEDEDTIKAVRGAIRSDNADVTAVDITFKNKSGNEIQPDKAVQVTIKSDSLAKAEDPVVVHVPDKGAPEKLTKKDNNIEVDNNKKQVSFEAKSFSVYAVIPGGTGDEARATVNFYGKNTTAPLATVYVKNSDNAAQIERIVYDPGAGLPWQAVNSSAAGQSVLSIRQMVRIIPQER